MLAESFGLHIPAWLSPIATFIIVGFFLYRSMQCRVEAGTEAR
jgi:hypothetical protein